MEDIAVVEVGLVVPAIKSLCLLLLVVQLLDLRRGVQFGGASRSM